MKIIAYFFALTCIACGNNATEKPASTPPPPPATAAPAPVEAAPAPAPAAKAETPVAMGPDLSPLVEAIRKDAVACFAAGKKADPTLTDGHVVLNVAARDGRATCIIPSEGAGIPREVESCMAARLAREPFPASAYGAAGASGDLRLAVPLEVSEKDVQLSKEQPRSGAAGIESLETHGVDRAGIVVMKLMDQVNECVLDGMAKKPNLSGFFYVHAKIDARGNVACTVANRGDGIPDDVQKCAMDAVAKWKFPKPKHGSGSVTIPIKVGKKI